MGKFELTVTLRPMMYNKSAKDQFEQTSAYMKDICRGRKHTTIAELTQEHNIHYHSIIEIEGIEDKDKLMNKFRPYNKYLGRKTCRMVQFEESYEKYVQKNMKETSKIIANPVISDDFNILPKIGSLDKYYV